MLLGSEWVGATFQQLFEEDESIVVATFIWYLDNFPWFSEAGVRLCKKPITASEIREVLSGFTTQNSPNLQGLLGNSVCSWQICLTVSW